MAAANAAHGRTVRADRQEALTQEATTRCAFKITLMTIAPIMCPPMTTTYASWSASPRFLVARPRRQSRIMPFSSRGVAGTSVP